MEKEQTNDCSSGSLLCQQTTAIASMGIDKWIDPSNSNTIMHILILTNTSNLGVLIQILQRSEITKKCVFIF